MYSNSNDLLLVASNHLSFLLEASYNTERSEEIEGESAQRCKARLERHRRTAERAVRPVILSKSVNAAFIFN